MKNNKCPYCTFDESGNGKKLIDDYGSELMLTFYKEDNSVYINTYEDSTPDINYCPMCGRPLAKGLFDYVPSTFGEYGKELKEYYKKWRNGNGSVRKDR